MTLERYEIIFVGECCANNFIASQLSEMIPISTKLDHTFRRSRERILKYTDDLAHKYRNITVVNIIDYERAEIPRRYLEGFFNIQESGIMNTIKLGVSKRHGRRVLAIIFDPRVEEGYLCILNREMCSQRGLNLIKSSNCETYLSRKLNGNEEHNRILERLVGEILSLRQR